MNPFKKIDQGIAHQTIKLIKIYQKTISPDHSWFGKRNPFHGCKYYPSCSEYARECLEKKGFVRSIFKISGRIVRCNPFSNGGVDFPFEKNKKNKI